MNTHLDGHKHTSTPIHRETHKHIDYRHTRTHAQTQQTHTNTWAHTNTCTHTNSHKHLQKSIFLVVIIESFADFRVESSDTVLPVTNKPTLVLHERQGQSSENLHLKLIKQESSTAFQFKLDKYYFTGWHGIGIEVAFICLVIIDAIVYASKYTGMPEKLGIALYAWQVSVVVQYRGSVISKAVYCCCY